MTSCECACLKLIVRKRCIQCEPGNNTTMINLNSFCSKNAVNILNNISKIRCCLVDIGIQIDDLDFGLFIC